MYVFLDIVLAGTVIALRTPWLVAFRLAIVAEQRWQARREPRWGQAVPGLSGA
jgi:hypothetical protein